ncbi:SNF2-related protein [Micromonospora sp. S4605]|uniref:SNF2-related protein n=1 Tax=Micromonospora sp. S4605 TaxID=1420897 RepID=UPI0011B777D1|nr:SNF2-related protein [Micromonospora sp. S4605]
MGELVSVERTITAELLENGEISLGPVEQTRLGLPSHSADLALVVDDESLAVAWVAGRRRLHGEALAEYLQDTARVGGLLRLERRGDGPLRLVVSAPGAHLSFAAGLPGAVVAARATPAASGAAAARSVASPRRRASTGSRYRLRKREEYAWQGQIGFLKSARNHAVSALKNRGWDPADAVELRLEGERLATLDQFDELLAIDAAHIEHMPHQEAAARTVLTRMGGRGILADEVGLGKTVEAGLILKELMLRGLAQRILIICPAPLRDQWRDELRDKFDEDFTVVASGQDARAFEQDRVIMTLQLVLRNAERFRKRFDLVIVDEAHRLSGAGAKRTREIVGGLVAKAPRALFLSATPVQNNLLELYRLVELLRPGTFDSEYDFSRRFVDRADPRRPVNAVELRKLISSVVVRTTRQQAGVDRVHRMPPQDHGVVLTPPERQLYDLLLHTLRHRMTGPADTMRRRQLALRLTASPQAVSRSALRMAEREPDRQLREVLAEIGHLAGDIRHTSREQTALKVVQRWLDEHGRVLMFTQHTDTLTGILRLLDGAGISAAPFHGGMTHAARSASVADFRSGRARVLVSTDAGAEGQNLQVSNCVLNYDLPWNPMRVEQRIGRVHRLTQTRDVHIANLFARDTLDEAVYRLLHDKLAMFELLFGQVVTVLGELEGTQDSSMENRVLEALYAKSDATMQRRLDELGNQLEQARSRAMTMMTADAGLSDWLAQRQEERRKRAAQPEARELLPQASKRPRRRQKDLERFVARFLTSAGATLSQPSEGLTVATLPDDLAEALGGRRELVLAFTNAALDHHPEAQLCVVGSELFDELLEVLRERGDLAGTVAELPDVHQRPVIAHSPDVQLVKRHIEPVDEWAARATYRVQEGATSGNQQLVSVAVGPAVDINRRRAPLPDGAPMPTEMAEKDVLETIDGHAAVKLRQTLREAREAEQRRQREAQEALVANLEKQLRTAEKAWQEAQESWHKRGAYEAYNELQERERQLNRAIEAARRPTPTEVDTELRAELLTLEMHGSDRLMVVERWEHANGTARELRYPWTGNLAQHGLTCEATGEPLATLTLCGGGHVVDRSALSACQTCETDWCGACGPERTVQECRGCNRGSCATCRTGGLLCTGCVRPQRAAELDSEWETGWRLGGAAYLLVGERHAVLVDGRGDRQTLVPAADVQDPARARLRGLAHRLRLPAGTGLVAAAPKVTPADLTAGSVWAEVSPSAWWTWQPGTGATIDGALVEMLPEVTGPPVAAENEAGFAALLADLRRRQPAPPAPAVAAMPFAVVRRVDIRDGRFVYRELWHDGDRTPHLAWEDRQSLQVSRHEVAPFCRPVAATVVGPVRVEVDGLHRSYLCLLTDGTSSSTLFVPGLPEATVRAEEHLARTVAAAGLPANRVVVRHPWSAPPAADLQYSSAATEVTVKRTVETRRTLVEQATGDAETGFLAVDSGHQEFAGAQLADDEALRAVLHGLAEPVAPVSVADCITIDEQWRSPHGTANRRYLIAPAAPLNARLSTGRALVAPGEPIAATLTDGTPARGQVYVDSGGHLIEHEQVSGCPVCARAYGPCCGDGGSITDCVSCQRAACGSCRSNDPSTVAVTRCARCGDHSCGECSRHLPVHICQLCGRDVCQACGPGPLCLTCQHLTPASQEQISGLPAALCADGLAVLVGEDAGGTVVVLHGASRSEIALISPSGVHRWETVTDDNEYLLRLRLGAAHRFGHGDVALRAVTPETAPTRSDWLVLDQSHGTTFQWEMQTADGRHAGNARGLTTRPSAGDLDLNLIGALDVALNGAAQVPVPTPSSASQRQAMRRLTGSLATSPPGTVAAACQQHTEVTLALTSNGLVRRRAVGSAIHEERVDWTTPDEAPPWAGDGWYPEPEVIAYAAMDGWTAVVAAVGQHALLGVCRDGDRSTWHRLTEKTEMDLFRAALGVELLGERSLVSVIAHTQVEQIQGPMILRARLMARRTSPAVSRQPFGQPRRTALSPATAVAAIVPHAKPGAPAAGVSLPHPVVHGLRARVTAHQVPKVDIAVGLSVEEQWRLPTGEMIRVRYAVPAGQTTGFVTDAATGEQLREAAACRRHHLVRWLQLCSTCLTATCAACPDAVRPCTLCGGRLCGSCVAGPDGRCPACRSLRKVGLLERGKFGVSLRGAAWHSVGKHVQVTVRRDKGRWTLERLDKDGRLVVALEGEQLLRVMRMLGEST